MLIHTVGWCKPAQEFMRKISTLPEKLPAKTVVFFSLSAAGWTSCSQPSSGFLGEWRDKFHIPFPVLASPRDAGRLFFEQPFVPNAEIIGADGKLSYKEIDPPIDTLFREIQKLLH